MNLNTKNAHIGLVNKGYKGGASDWQGESGTGAKVPLRYDNVVSE